MNAIMALVLLDQDRSQPQSLFLLPGEHASLIFPLAQILLQSNLFEKGLPLVEILHIEGLPP